MPRFRASNLSMTSGQSAANPVSLPLRVRLFQVRALAALLAWIGGHASGRRLIVRLRANQWSRSFFEFGLAFRRTFSSFSAAQSSASKYIAAGHEHPDEIRYHTSIADSIRESDYPILFHLASIAPGLRRVFDLGGHVGNLFYAYQHKLCFPPNLTWTVYDLPHKRPFVEKLALDRRETRIHFADNLAEANGSEVFIASGSLHYFDQPLHEILRALDSPPPHVFVNRTPFSAGNSLITVQDNRSYLVPCALHSRPELISEMAGLGYELVSEWPVHERKLCVPLYPDLTAHTYEGFYFRRRLDL
jgi:putative methyltransferase (TIGR04325 family)